MFRHYSRYRRAVQTPSWHWFYPYHFSPFASDFTDLDQMDIKFDLGLPSKPYEQLMGVFPAARYTFADLFSKSCLDADGGLETVVLQSRPYPTRVP
jgi:5'-3' exonuclease